MSSTIDKVAWISLSEGKLLCVRSKGKSLYYLPGGKREPGESDAQTLVREIEEELSVRIRPDTVLPRGVFEAAADGKADGITVRMACYTGEYDGELSAAAEIEELAWLGYEDRARVSLAGQLVMDHLRENGDM